MPAGVISRLPRAAGLSILAILLFAPALGLLPKAVLRTWRARIS